MRVARVTEREWRVIQRSRKRKVHKYLRYQ